jgi:negative regulator of sigma E activity
MNEQENIGEQLSAYLDGELSDEQARRVEQALRDDPRLARELADLKAARDLVRSLPPHKAPEDFAATLMDKAERLRLMAPLPGAAAKWSINWASLATAALVLIAVGIGVVVTVSLTLTPSWTERVARQEQTPQAAPAPQESAKQPPGAEASPVALARDSKSSLGGAAEAVREVKEAAAKPVEGAKAVDTDQAGRGAAEVSAPVVAEGAQPGEPAGSTIAGSYGYDQNQKDRSKDRLAAAGGSLGVTEASSPGPEDQDAMVPALAAAPGPRPDRPPGVITQVGEPLYHPPLREQGTVAGQPAPSGQPLAEAEAPQFGKLVRAIEANAPSPPASQPTSEPTSQPTSAPASRPSSEPSDIPVFPMEDEQTKSEGAPAGGTGAAETHQTPN